MNLDAEVCYCFHVTRRKLLAYLRVEKPCVPSQLSQCNGAGTGCGWCVPFLRQLFDGASRPNDLDALAPEEYARRRAEYIRAGRGKPPGEGPCEDLTPQPPLPQGEGEQDRPREEVTPSHSPPAPPLPAGEGVGG